MSDVSHARVSRRRSGRAFGWAVVLGSAALLASPLAQAHFILETPASWRTQDSLGLPEKLGPCGNEDGGTLTGAITGLHPGETVTITINEVVFHPGHYRIAVVTDRSLLPAEPPVEAGATPCGSVPIQSPPVFPVLADGVFEHTAAFTSPQSVQVTLPAGLTCAKCTLQVIEFMSDHVLNDPGGCFYHHCADLSIASGADADGAVGAGNVDAGSGGGSSGSSGGGSSGAGVPTGSSSGAPGGGGPTGESEDASTGAVAAAPSSGGCGISGAASGTGAIAALAGAVVLAGGMRLRRRLRSRR